MLTYNSLSLYLQIIINVTLLTGLILFVKKGIKPKTVLFLFLSGESVLELSDLISRMMKLNTFNTYNYSLSQFFSLIMLTEIYNTYFIRIPHLVRLTVYVYATVCLIFNLMYVQNITSVTFYSNIISTVIICSFAAVYFLNVIRKSRADRDLLIVNILAFLFFSIESLISTTFNFLISNHLAWVAPIWLFRGVLLWSFYIAFINLGCRIGKIRAC